MNAYADLEISLHRHDAEAYSVEFRFNLPDSDADTRLGQGKPALAHFDFTEFETLSFDLEAYGQSLTRSLFGGAEIGMALAQARAAVQALDIPLRLRLFVGPTASELHSLIWETLRDPQDGAPLCTNQNILFSRYLSSLDARPVRPRPKGELNALVAIANPADLIEYKNLAPIDVEGESSRAKAALGNIPAALLAGAGTQDGATLNNIMARLQAGDQYGSFDILYLVCHGALVDNEPVLWLEDDAGMSARTSGEELVTRLRELQQIPRLAVLASCQSAASTAGRALAALGPRLAEAGIPAVLAMQGNVTMKTVAEFMPAFFSELQREGYIDRAVTVARGAVRDEPDYWVPVLFMRLKSGRLWYVPGFGGRFEKWPTLIRSIRQGQCTPILGFGLRESLFGSLREVAQRWAEKYHYPMAPHERESLPQVAQFLAVDQGSIFPYGELEDYFRQALLSRCQSDLPAGLNTETASLVELIDAAGAVHRRNNPYEPHKVLAQLPLPLYVTTNQDNLLASSLREAGKDPCVAICPWNDYIAQNSPSIYDEDPGYLPTPERPLVYHLFGRFDEPDSLVLTEDDYFDFLIGMRNNLKLIPNAVQRALADTSLLFLGFQMDDWNFRVILRSLLSLQGGSRRHRYAHIAAQIEPEEWRILEPGRARRYLENYFSSGADINIYWGVPEDFLKELVQRWNQPAG